MNQPTTGKNLLRERKAEQVVEWFTQSSSTVLEEFLADAVNTNGFWRHPKMQLLQRYLTH